MVMLPGDVACMHAGFEYIGAGSNRNFCFTDLLLRERCTTDIARLSAANWGTIEVKGPWQLSLPENMSLAEAVAHPDHRKEVLPAVQQVRLHCDPGHQVVYAYEVLPQLCIYLHLQLAVNIASQVSYSLRTSDNVWNSLYCGVVDFHVVLL